MSRPYQEWQSHWQRLEATVELEPARAWRHRMVASLAVSHVADLPRATVVDLGCGRGEVLRSVRASAPATLCLGLDGSSGPAWRGVVDVHFVQTPLDGVEVSHPVLGDHFGRTDVVICSEVLEHMDDERVLLRLIRGLLAPSGIAILTVPGGPIGHIDRHFGHRRHYSRRTLQRLLSESGLSICRHDSLGAPFFNLYRLGLCVGGAVLTQRVAASRRSEPQRVTRLLFVLFGLLMRLPTPRRLGWQHLVVASRASHSS